MPRGVCEFQSSLMKKADYCWLREGSDKHHAKCEVCQKEFSVTWGCEPAVKKHQGGDKHKQNMKSFENSKKGLSSLFFRKLPDLTASTSSSNLPSSSTSATLNMIDKMVASQALVTAAECRMILRLVKNHSSFRSCLGLGEDLKAMFPDSAIASNFTLSKTK